MKTQRKARKGGPNPAAAAAARKDTAVGERPGGEGAAAGVAAAPPCPLSPRLRLIISVVLLFHLGAVLVAALNVPPVSGLVSRVARGIRWHTETLLVMPGYRFFAPNPGPADMMRVAILSADGERREEDYPDIKRQWPRLLYHRHFMLTSRLSLEPDAPMVQAFARSYARHVAARENAREVSVYRLVHALPTMEQVRAGAVLSDKDTYRIEYDSPTGTWTSRGLPTFDGTRLELEIRPDRTASLIGTIRGRTVTSTWTWQPGSPGGPRQIAFLAKPGEPPEWTADSPQPNELVLHYPAPAIGPVVRVVGGVEHVPMRRDPPPLAVYPGDEP